MKTLTVREAARVVKKGGVVVFPTETFYGLAVNPHSEAALEKIFEIKERERGKPVALILSSSRQLAKWVSFVGEKEKKLIRKFWPGPLTLVFSAASCVSPRLTAGRKKIGVRVSPHPVAMELAKACGGAITATSANLSGEPAVSSARKLSPELLEKVEGVLEGLCPRSSKGSTVLDVSNRPWVLIREGEVAIKEIPT